MMMSRTILLLICLLQIIPSSTAIWGRKKASPSVILLKVPKGLLPDCDLMETTIRQVESELKVKVHRIDVLRDPAAEALLNRFGNSGETMQPPVLFHRDSLQCLTGRASIDQVRALVQGRLVQQNTKLRTKPNAQAPMMVVEQEDKSLDQSELLEDLSLTPEQREGKRKMEERSNAK